LAREPFIVRAAIVAAQKARRVLLKNPLSGENISVEDKKTAPLRLLMFSGLSRSKTGLKPESGRR
jgi:hypothetical protein